MSGPVATLIALALQPLGSDPGLPERLATQPTDFKDSLGGFMLIWLFVGVMVIWSGGGFLREEIAKWRARRAGRR